MTKLTSSMELLTLFHKTDFEVTKATVYCHKLLSVLLTFVNHDVSQGYKAWPATDLLKRRTGMGKTSLTKYRKALLDAGLLLQIVPNAGPGRSCIYYINADLIKELARKAGATVSDRPVGQAVLPEVREIHKRNTSGLMKGKEAPEQPAAPPIEQDNSWAHFEAENVSETVLVAPEPIPDGNADGSPRFFKNGTRRYSWDDVMQPLRETTENDPF